MPWVDRTSQFRSLGGGGAVVSSSSSSVSAVLRGAPSLSVLPPSHGHGQARRVPSQFHAMARALGDELTATSLHLAELTKMTRSSSLKDEQGARISEKTLFIKRQMEGLHEGFRNLQQFAESHKSRDAQLGSHENHVVSTLKQKLLSAKEQFQGVLQERTEKIKKHQGMRTKYTSSPAKSIRSSKKRVSGSSSLSLPDLEAPREDESGQQLMLRAQQQQLLIREESGEQEYYQQRQQAIQQIESTMRDLSVMFQDLHQLVQEQEEMVQRVDTNVEAALLDLEQGQSQLAIYLEGLKSSRWLVFKVMVVLVLFIIFFAVFMM